MAFNNGFPMNYPQMYPQYNNYIPQIPQQQIPQQQAAPQSDNSINWVQGLEGAKSWNVAPGKSVMLMDSESSVFYIKSSDNSGMPMPLRIFDYKERSAEPVQKNEVAPRNDIDTSMFVTWDVFNSKMQEVKDLLAENRSNQNGVNNSQNNTQNTQNGRKK